MNKHTPGPWKWDEENHRITAKGPTGDFSVLHSYADYGDPSYIEVDDDDARLMATAPELVAACELSLDVLKNKNCPWTCGELEKAIAKAKGA